MDTSIKLLDCTLRDGGYVNDWNFGRDNMVSIFERLVSSGVDVIEVGFLDERRPFDPDRTILPDTVSVDRSFGKLHRGHAMTVAMIDYGTCSLDKLQPCAQSWLDGIRVIFKKEVMGPALDFCAGVQLLGYRVFVQAVSITSYDDSELKELVKRVNALHPYAFSMVDTYGLLNPASLLDTCRTIDAVLDRDICLGFHAHNNFQLGYANAMALINSGVQRQLLVDGTLYGMGKSAGNAPIELVAMYLNENRGTKYDVLQMQEAISTCVLDMYQNQPWGYTLFYYIAASNQCHPDYVSYLMNKRTLSITAINEILQQIPPDKKLGKDQRMLERLYMDYQKNEYDDSNAVARLAELLADKNILMLGPGSSVESEAQTIRNFVHTESPVVVSINYIPRLVKADYLFLTNSKRYLEMSGMLTEEEPVPIVATSNVTKNGGVFPFVINYSSLIDTEAEFPDNSMIMLLKLLETLGVGSVTLAGFDGYTPDNINYFNKKMEYSFVKEKSASLNAYANQFLAEYKRRVNISFLTKTLYLQ